MVKPRRLLMALGATAAMVLAAVGCTTRLGTLGGANSAAFDVNDEGVVVGWAEDAGGVRHAFFQRSGAAMQQLEGGAGSQAWAINNGGIAVGTDGTQLVAWDIQAGTKRVLDCPNPGQGILMIYDINESGLAVGRCGVATVWDTKVGGPGRTIAIGPRGATTFARGINDAGQVVGSFTYSLGPTPQGQSRFRTAPYSYDYATQTAAGFANSGSPPVDSGGYVATDINNAGEVVGYLEDRIRGVITGVYWTGAGNDPRTLVSSSGDSPEGDNHRINERGETAISVTYSPTGEDPTFAAVGLLSIRTGVFTRLATNEDAGPPVGLNDRGTVAGTIYVAEGGPGEATTWS